MQAHKKELDLLINALNILQGNLATTQLRTGQLTAIQSQVTTFSTALTGSGGAALQALAKAEALNCALLGNSDDCAANEARPFILVTKMTAIGGDNITRQNIFGSKIAFSGEITSTYTLYDSSGLISTAGMSQCYGAVNVKDLISTGIFADNKVSCRDMSTIQSIRY